MRYRRFLLLEVPGPWGASALDESYLGAGVARQIGLGRVSMWSLNRDSKCGASFPEIGLISNTCSGTAESGLQFTDIFDKLPGQAIAFAKTREERLARGDSRLSLDERYPSRDDYVSKVAAAAAGLARGRLLLEEDVETYVKKAQAAPLDK